MKFNKTTQYAIRIMAFMVRNPEKTYSAKFLHTELGLPYKYITKLMTSLAKKNLVTMERGRNGGFKFADELDHIMLIDVIDAVEGKVEFGKCVLGLEKCDDSAPCCMHHFWVDIREQIEELVSTISLSQLGEAEMKALLGSSSK